MNGSARLYRLKIDLVEEIITYGDDNAVAFLFSFAHRAGGVGLMQDVRKIEVELLGNELQSVFVALQA